jgi:tetratricopeptide (TPR) repeat protein
MTLKHIGAIKPFLLCTALSVLCADPAISTTLLAHSEMPASTAESTLGDAKSLENRGAYEEALQKYKAVLKDSPSSSPARRGVGRSLAKLGRCNEAEAVFKPVTPLSALETEESLGVCFFRMHKYDAAIIHLKNAQKLSPQDREACISLARAYASLGRSKDGIGILKAWLTRNPGDADALYWTGTLYNSQAQQVLDTMTASNPNHYLVHEWEGDQFRLRQDFNKALTAYQEALKAAPDTPGMHFNVGDVYYRMLKFPEAKEELEKELAINPDHAQANFEVGEINIKEGKNQEGMAYLQRAVKLDPSLVEAHRALGRALMSEKQYEEAVRELSLVAKSDPSDHTIHAMLAVAYRQMGRVKDAEREAQISEKLMNDRATRLQHLKAEEQEINDEPSLPPENH